MNDCHKTALLASVLCAELQRDPEILINIYQTADDAVTLRKLARRVQRIVEDGCNGAISEEQETVALRAIRDKATPIAERYGAGLAVGGDPRGFVLMLSLRSGRSNSFAGKAWGVE